MLECSFHWGSQRLAWQMPRQSERYLSLCMWTKSRTHSSAASRHISLRSLPEKPSVSLATSRRSTDRSTCREADSTVNDWLITWISSHWSICVCLCVNLRSRSPGWVWVSVASASHSAHTYTHQIHDAHEHNPVCSVKICIMCTSVCTGWFMWNLVGILLKMAESRSCGRLVAPMMITWHTQVRETGGVQFLTMEANYTLGGVGGCVYTRECVNVCIHTKSNGSAKTGVVELVWM